MLGTTRTINLRGVELRLRWDAGAAMHAENKLKLLAKDAGATRAEIAEINIMEGATLSLGTAIAFLWGAIVAGAAEYDKEPPVSWLQLGGLLDSQERINEVSKLIGELVFENSPRPTPGKAPARKSNRAKKSRSKSSTSGARSTSESPRASSGA